ncbi:activating transcription factor 7-interacting protein 2 [Apteryx rowi]|uniref:activating transcription factor 7-interacting protein 2 n=1 Tax=Apteryx rowi TaxID=308060 RepID=UPI000E1D091F|nr:activating transcription factor 7-interacting protein 2 [Apteryx rowi]
MEYSNKILQKPLQAKKPMTPSNGKQVEKPNKIRNASAEEKILYGLQTKDHSLQPSTLDIICKSKDYVKIKVFSESNATSVLPEKKSSVILPRVSISSVANKECCYDINVDQNSSQEECQDPVPDIICNKNSDAKQLLNARCLKVILHKWYENGVSTAPSKSVEVCLCSSLNGLPIDRVKESASEAAIDSESKGKRTNSVVPILEKMGIKPGTKPAKKLVPVLKKIDEIDASKKKKENCAALVTPMKTTRDRNAALSGGKVSGGDDSSNIFEDDEIMLPDTLCESSIENTQRKRVCSGSKENIQCKRIKISDEIKKENTCTVSKKEENLLGKIKLMIREQMEILNTDFFNHKLEGLSGRVEQAQCWKKHEELAITFLKKVSKLERRINTVIAFQKKVLSKMVAHQTRLPSADSQNTILNQPGSSASFLNTINTQQSCSSKLLLSSHAGFTSACVSEDASSDEVILISVEGQNSATANNSDIPNNQISTQAEMSATAQSKIKERKLEVIDLTEDEKHNSSKGKTEKDQKSVSHEGNSKPACLSSACLKLPAETSNEAPKQFPHLPSLPRIPPCPELTEEFRDTVPPQKPELKVAQVQNPKGIALSWTIKEMDPKCAPLDSYHLYLFHENLRNTSASRWKKIGKIRALPLPMACSLSQFTIPKTYYFAIQSKDICGRYGPFCDIQSITLSL